MNIVWHKMSDLRVHDHEPLSRAHLMQSRLPVIHMHVFDPFWFGKTRIGRFQKTGPLRAAFWLESVEDLRMSLRKRGQDLLVRIGMSAAEALRQLASTVRIASAFTYNDVCQEELDHDAAFETALREVTGGTAELVRCWGYTIHHIDDLQKCSRPPEKWITPYLSFGTFKREIRDCRIRPVAYEWQARGGSDSTVCLSAPPEADGAWWGLIPSLGDLGFTAEEEAEVAASKTVTRVPWRGGESVALALVEAYIWERRALKQYVGTTDWTALGKCSAPRDQTTKLSAHLAFGCLSPRLLYWEIMRFEKSNRCKGARGLVNSLLWRDFYRFIFHYAWGNRVYHLYGPTSCGSVPGGHRTPTKWCCKHYNNIFGGSDPRLWTWGKDKSKLARWTEGTTGYPFVDASMLELRRTGYMLHLNRETVGWFFVRDLQLDWRLAAEWFESRLIDYDCILNWGNWAYFILTQLPAREDDRPGGGPRYTLPRYSPYLMASQVLVWGAEHDPSSAYVKKFIPQLHSLPSVLAREPWRLAVDSAEAAILLGGQECLTAGWACEACTLENLFSRRFCEACGSRRPRLDSDVAAACEIENGVFGPYSEPPMVPPPPDSDGSQGECSQCGQLGIGWAGDNGTFLCEGCWSQDVRSAPEGGFLPSASAEQHEPPLDVARGWALVPAAALPLAVGSPSEGESVGVREERWPLAAGKPSKSARWAVRGEKSSLDSRVVGA